MEQGLGRTLASPLSEMGSMEGSEQRGGTPDLGDYRHRLETAGATVGGGVGGESHKNQLNLYFLKTYRVLLA